jgi:hypothetical protein
MGAPLTAAPVTRPAIGFGHFPHFVAHGFNRFGFSRFHFNHFGFNRFDRFGFNRFHHFGFNRFGFHRFGFNRFGFNQFGFNQFGFAGCCGWGGFTDAFPESSAGPIVIGGPSVAIGAGGGDPGPGDPPGGGYTGGCVIHKLIYDRNGKYLGERQFPQC